MECRLCLTAFDWLASEQDSTIMGAWGWTANAWLRMNIHNSYAHYFLRCTLSSSSHQNGAVMADCLQKREACSHYPKYKDISTSSTTRPATPGVSFCFAVFLMSVLYPAVLLRVKEMLSKHWESLVRGGVERQMKVRQGAILPNQIISLPNLVQMLSV